MNDTREALASLIYEHERVGRSCIGCYACPGREFMNGVEYAEHVAELIAAEFLVIPRSDIIGTEYGWRAKPEQDVRVEPLEIAAQVAAMARQAQRVNGWAVEAETLERPVLPWSAISLPEDGAE